MADWTGILVVVGVAFLVFLLKYIIIRCYLSACRNGGIGIFNDNEGGLRRTRDAVIIDILESRNQRATSRKPPPKFENALKCSSPVSTIDLVDNSPPPTYEEYLNMTRGSGSTSAIITIPQIHQSNTNNSRQT